MVDDTNGIVVQPNNTLQLTEAMQTLMANKLAYNAHQISQAASKRYSEKAVAAAFIKIYKAIVPNFAE
jgi:glycosyltransferase involved in cell wall biosynthesis